MRRVIRLAALCCVLATPAWADALRLEAPSARAGTIAARLLQPFEVTLVAVRDTTHSEVSAVAYTLDLPEGIQLVGEELLVESILGLGSSRGGMNLVFRCAAELPLPVVRFRCVATRPVEGAVLALRPDTRTRFLGLVACRDENFAKVECPADSLRIDAR